jgi:hypothetical protein
MAFTEFYVRPAGVNTSAGSTDTDAPTVAAQTNGDWNNATANTFTAASGTPFSGVTVGMWASIYVDGSASTGYIARITAVNGGGASITLSTTAVAGTAPTASATGRTCVVGGAWGTIQQGLTLLASTATDASGNVPRCNIKNSSTYTIAAGLSRSANGPVVFRGYTTTPGDGGRATIDLGGASNFVGLTVSGANNVFRDMIIQNGGTVGGGSDGVSVTNTKNELTGITVHDVGGHGFNISSSSTILTECEAYFCNKGNNSNRAGFIANANCIFDRCISHDHPTGTTSHGFISASLTNTFLNCIADRCSGSGFLINGSTAAALVRCDAFKCAGAGYSVTATTGLFLLENCNAVENGTVGLSVTPTTGIYVSVRTLGVYNNGGDGGTGTNACNNTVVVSISNQVNYTTNPYANASTAVRPSAGDFTPSLATAKNAGRGTFTMDTTSGLTYSAGTTSFPDIGAAQHNDTGGGGGYRPGGLFVRGEGPPRL